MTQKKSLSIPLVGSLEGIVIRKLSFSTPLDGISGHAKGQETVIRIRLGLNASLKTDPDDAYRFNVDIDVEGKDPKTDEVLFEAACYATGQYECKDGRGEYEESEFARYVVERGNLQVYPVARSYLVQLLQLNGIQVADFPFEAKTSQVTKRERSLAPKAGKRKSAAKRMGSPTSRSTRKAKGV